MFKDLAGCHNFFISVYTFGMTVKNIWEPVQYCEIFFAKLLINIDI